MRFSCFLRRFLCTIDKVNRFATFLRAADNALIQFADDVEGVSAGHVKMAYVISSRDPNKP